MSFSDRLKGTISVKELRGHFSPRSPVLDLDHARRLAEVWDDLTNILVHRDTMKVVDGVHRLHAAKHHLRRDMVTVAWYEGTEDDARDLAVKTNREHGLPLTLANRSVVARQTFETFRQLSDRRTRPDGIWGSGSDRACRSFQESQGLLVDGIAGPATFTALADGAFARLVSTRHSPRTHAAGVAQMLLAARGYPPERSFRFLSHGRAVPDRIVGRLTDQAIRAFQRSRGIGVDGIVGPQTWGRLVA